MPALPPALTRVLAPIEALLADTAVQRVLIDGQVHTQQGATWTTVDTAIDTPTLAAALDALAELLGTPNASCLTMGLDDQSVLVGVRPPVVEAATLMIHRPTAAPVDLAKHPEASATLRLALSRGLNLGVIGPADGSRLGWMRALTALAPETRWVVVDMPADVAARTLTLRSDGGDGPGQREAVIDAALQSGAERVVIDLAEGHGAWPTMLGAARRTVPTLLGIPGRAPEAALMGLIAQMQAARTGTAARNLVAAGLDVLITVDGDRLVRVDAVAVGASGPRLTCLHRARPDGQTTTEAAAHDAWHQQWYRTASAATPPTSLPPESLTEALRMARAVSAPAEQVATPQARSTPRVTYRVDAEAHDAAPEPAPSDPLQALLASLGEDDEVAVDIEDEHEETMVQVQGIISPASKRTFSEILRSLGETHGSEGSMHVRRTPRVTRRRDED